MRARFIGLGALVVSTGLVYLALGELYSSLNEDRYEWDQLEMRNLELGVSVGIALMIAFTVWRIFHPGRYVEDEDVYVPVGEGPVTVSDDSTTETRR